MNLDWILDVSYSNKKKKTHKTLKLKYTLHIRYQYYTKC